MNTYAKVLIFIIILAVLAWAASCLHQARSGPASSGGFDAGISGDDDAVSGTGSGNEYVNADMGFSISLPSGYVADDTYAYQPDPNRSISGVKFTIPASVASGTNLSMDSYVSVESVPLPASAGSKGSGCTASLFLDASNASAAGTLLNEDGNTYSVASSSDAGAGNRYEETVYAIQGLNPAAAGSKVLHACFAIRYFVHYGAIQNYPEGTVAEFDKQSLLAQFDGIRRTFATK